MPDMAADMSTPPPDLTRPPETVTGKLVDDNGAPRADVACQLCSKSICLTARTAADGKVGFAPKLIGDYHFRSFSDDPITFGDVFFPVPIGPELMMPGFKRALGDAMIAPNAGTGQDVTVATGGTFTFGTIKLDVPAGSLTLANLDPSGKLFALAIPRAKVATQLLASRAQLDDGVFLTLPFGALCDKAGGKECKLTVPSALPDTTKVTIAMPNLETGVLEDVGEGTVTGGVMVSDAGKGLASLGWIVLYKK
jgi:hypothetical protein